MEKKNEIIRMYSLYIIILALYWILLRNINFLKSHHELWILIQIGLVFMTVLPFVAIQRKNSDKWYFGEVNKTSAIISGIVFITAILFSGYVLLLTKSVKILIFKIIFLFCIAAVEEYIFRGYFYQKLELVFRNKKQGLILAIFVQTMLFTMSHIFVNIMASGVDFFAFITQFIAGVIFSLIRWKTKNIAVPIGVHWLLDLTNLL